MACEAEARRLEVRLYDRNRIQHRCDEHTRQRTDADGLDDTEADCGRCRWPSSCVAYSTHIVSIVAGHRARLTR